MTATYTESVAKRLAVGDYFIRFADRADSELNCNWSWELLVHDPTERGDYSSIVEVDASTWTERFDPDEPVWLVTYAPSQQLLNEAGRARRLGCCAPEP